MKESLLFRLGSIVAARGEAALVTRLSDGAQALVHSDGREGELDLDEAALAEVRNCMRADRSERLSSGLFVRTHARPMRIVIVGAVHVAQYLCRLAHITGFEAIVIDPRTAFATAERFADVRIIAAWPDKALREIGLDRRTAVVTLSHDTKLDDPAIIEALRSEVFYLGCLGSRKSHAGRLERLKAAGVDEARFARIHAPVGLPLGGRRPADIAVSILSEIMQEWYGRK